MTWLAWWEFLDASDVDDIYYAICDYRAKTFRGEPTWIILPCSRWGHPETPPTALFGIPATLSTRLTNEFELVEANDAQTVVACIFSR